MKKYQHALLFFALGIAAVTFLAGWLIGKKTEFDQTAEQREVYKTVAVKIYFPNFKEDPETSYCGRTYPVEREVTSKTIAGNSQVGERAYLAVKELLKGPTESEKEAGFTTAVNNDVEIKEISIIGDLVTINFNSNLNRGVAGSCRVLAIRSQIENTLKQFSEIKTVDILAEGEREGILEP